MLPLVEFPELVQHYAPHFAPVFSPEAWIEFERYISGLIVSENKTVDGINRLCVHVSGRYVWAHNLVTLHYSDDDTDYPVAFQVWQPVDLEHLEHGLRAADIPLKAAKQALKSDAPHKWRQYLLGVWRRRQTQHPELAALYDSKLRIGEHLLQQWGAAHPDLKLPVAFDTWYTQPAFCHYLDQTLQWPFVGALALDDEVVLRRGTQRLAQFAEDLKQEPLTAVERGAPGVFQPIGSHYRGTKERYYSYCQTHRLKDFGRLRLVINHRQADLSDAPVCLIANRLHWHAPGITRIYRYRWPVEVYHEEGKAEGLDQYQLRDFGAVDRHAALVAVVYSLLRAAQHDPSLQGKLQRQLKLKLEARPSGSAAFWQRVTPAQSLWSLAVFISAGLSQGQSLRTLMAPLLRAVCAA